MKHQLKEIEGGGEYSNDIGDIVYLVPPQGSQLWSIMKLEPESEY